MAVSSSDGSVSLPDRTRRPLDASALGSRSLADVRAVHAAHRACSSLSCQCGSSPQPRLVGGTILRIHLRKRGPTGPAFGDDDAIRSTSSFGFGGASRARGPTYRPGGIVGLEIGKAWVREKGLLLRVN